MKHDDMPKPRISRAEASRLRAALRDQRALDERLDAALCETFPASDAVAISLLVFKTPRLGPIRDD